MHGHSKCEVIFGSALRQQVKNLEEELGCRLLERQIPLKKFALMIYEKHNVLKIISSFD
jgi:hypothetical protein